MLPPHDRKPNPARMYDYILGGFHNFEVDRQAVAQLIAANPDAVSIARSNRAFVQRVVRFYLDQGIDQFLDIGAGMPTTGNTHEIAQQRYPQPRVVYVDIDLYVIMYARTVLSNNPTVGIIQADIRDTHAITNHDITRRLLDWQRPIGVLATSILPFVTDDTEAIGAMQRLIAALPDGSYVALTHGIDTANIGNVEAIYERTTRPGYTRSRTAIEGFFAGLTLVEPGIVYVPEWHPDGPDDIFFSEPSRAVFVGGVGYKQ